MRKNIVFIFDKNKFKKILICTSIFFILFITISSLLSETKALDNNSFLKSVNLSFEQITPVDKNVTYERIIMQNKEQRELDSNGTGSQWPTSLAVSKNGDLMLYGNDVAGMYKSTDHGENWVQANSGLESRGIGMFAIDPYNSNHIVTLGLGTNAGGIYISYDKANTWKKTFVLKTTGTRYLWDGLEFDPTSYDETTHLTKVIYLSTPYERDTLIRNSSTAKPTIQSPLSENQVGLYKSTDGGETFELIINNKELADGIIKITDSGNVYVGNQYGLFLIDKENNTVARRYIENDGDVEFAKGVTGLDVVNNTLYVQTWDGIFILENDELTKITNENYLNKWPQFLEVSKTNPNHMVYQVRKDINNYYVSKAVVSFDGGNTWEYSENEKNSLFFKSSWDGREKVFIIDPSNDNIVLTFALDTVVRSTDGGRNYKQVKGISNMMQGGKFNFNYYDPDLLVFSAQDYTGVISYDGGNMYTSLSSPLGRGNFYGGFAADKDTIYGFANSSWNGGSLVYTHDGGNTWIDTGLTSKVVHSKFYSSLQSPTNPNVLFAAEYFSTDKGYTWNKMNGCKSVYTFNYTNKNELYGGDNDGNLVVSYDNGITWEKLSSINWNKSANLVSQEIVDIAYDHINNIAYIVVQNKIGQSEKEEVYKYDITNRIETKLVLPTDSRNHERISTVAVDPNSTSVVYVGGAGNYYLSSTSLLRSIDGGETWTVLTTSNTTTYPLKANNQGGYEVSNIRVNPYDGKVWIAEGCYGYEIIDPPYDASQLNHTKPQNHQIKFIYNDAIVNEITIKNNDKLNYIYELPDLTFISWYKDNNFQEEFSNGNNVYESMTLYAKMKKSIKVKFYDRNKFLWKIDLDKFDLGNEELIPTRDGYAFAGWYADSSLNTKADFSSIKSNTNVYAGWYKIIQNVFDINRNDIGNYIKYSNYTIQDAIEVTNEENVNERSIHMKIDKNSKYLITFKMDTRFRLGMRTKSFKYWPHNPVLEPYIDEKDINGIKPVNEYVYKVIETNDYEYLLIYYYTWSGSRDFMDIKSTFKIYKLENDDVKENNQKIEGIDYSIIDGNNQTYTINLNNNAIFQADGELSNFSFAEIDGDTIPSSNYTLENGSTIITLKKEFMDTLEYNKEHDFNIIYKDGGEASTKFNVLFQNIVNDNTNNNSNASQEQDENNDSVEDNSNSNQGQSTNNNTSQKPSTNNNSNTSQKPSTNNNSNTSQEQDVNNDPIEEINDNNSSTNQEQNENNNPIEEINGNNSNTNQEPDKIDNPDSNTNNIMLYIIIFVALVIGSLIVIVLKLKKSRLSKLNVNTTNE